MKVKVWKKIYYESFNKKEAGVAILISNKTDFRAKKITRKGYYIMTKWPIHQKDIAILNGKCKNNNAEKYVKKYKKAGFDSEIIETDNLYRVSLGVYGDKVIALHELRRIRAKEDYSNAWLYTKAD